ncbi:MAG TPA: hypothetical protein VGF27_06555 [Pseudoduganella sp.]
MNKNKQEDPPIKHCEITVTRLDDGSYEATYEPKVINVTDNDTILSFKLVQAPADVIIRSVSINPEDQDQLSTPSISRHGNHVTLSDVNTQRDTFHLDFTYGSKKGEKLAVAAAKMGVMGGLYPEISNDPP